MIPMRVFSVLVISLGVLLVSEDAFALKQLKGQEAKDYLGSDIKGRFTTGGYSYEILKRSHRDSMNARASDALIFNKQGNQFHYLKRKDGNHDFILNHPEGRVEDPVSDNPLVWNPIQNTLDDDHPKPNVFLDDEGNEIAVVFIGPKTQLKAKMENGLLRLKIKVKQVDYRRKAGPRS